MAKALLGLTIDTPIGKQTIREKDHQANRGQLYGKTVKDPKYPFAIMKPVDYVDPTRFMDYRQRGRVRRASGSAIRSAPPQGARRHRALQRLRTRCLIPRSSSRRR